MKRYLPYFTLMLCLIFIAVGCKKDDVVQKSETSKLVQNTITGVNGPANGKVGEELTFDLVWQNAAGNLKFDHLQDSVSGDTTMVRLFTLTHIADSSVTHKGLNTTPYKFKATLPGTYFLKFYGADSTQKAVIVDTLTIN